MKWNVADEIKISVIRHRKVETQSGVIVPHQYGYHIQFYSKRLLGDVVEVFGAPHRRVWDPNTGIMILEYQQTTDSNRGFFEMLKKMTALRIDIPSLQLLWKLHIGQDFWLCREWAHYFLQFLGTKTPSPGRLHRLMRTKSPSGATCIAYTGRQRRLYIHLPPYDLAHNLRYRVRFREIKRFFESYHIDIHFKGHLPYARVQNRDS